MPFKSKLQRAQEGVNEMAKPLTWEDIRQLAPKPAPPAAPPEYQQTPEENNQMNRKNAASKQQAYQIMDQYAAKSGTPVQPLPNPGRQLQEDAQYYDSLQQFESDPQKKEAARQQFLKIQKMLGK